MMKRIHIVPYKMGSTSAGLLKEELCKNDIKAFRKVTEKEKTPRAKTLVIYYGGTDVYPEGGIQLNRVREFAQNKLNAFQKFDEHGVTCVPWTTDRAVAEQWYREGHVVVNRKSLTGHSGQGIELQIPTPDGIFQYNGVRVFTKYVKKMMECRIHVFGNKVIDAQVKRRRADIPEDQEIDTRIRNKHTGWVYCRENFDPAEAAKELAIKAVQALQLDFGAVDIIWNMRENKYYVLEVNTAPGLEGTTLQSYTKEFLNVYNTN